MTLLSVVKDVCAAVGVTIPTSVFSNITGNRTMQEMLSELEALRAKNALLEEDIRAIKDRGPEFTPTREDRFDGMNLDELREFVTTNTGQAPLGSMNRKTLIRLARDAAGNSTTKAA